MEILKVIGGIILFVLFVSTSFALAAAMAEKLVFLIGRIPFLGVLILKLGIKVPLFSYIFVLALMILCWIVILSVLVELFG